MADGDAGELVGADVGGADEGEVAGVEVGVGHEEVVGDDEAEGGVAHEFQPLVAARRRVGVGGVGQRLPEQRRTSEPVFEHRLHRRQPRRLAVVVVHRRRGGQEYLCSTTTRLLLGGCGFIYLFIYLHSPVEINK